MWLVNGIQYNYTPLMDLRYAMGERSHSLQRLASVGSWGTQVELQAVSDCFSVTVFVCSPNISQIIRWEIKGTPKHHSIHIPPVSLHATLPFTHSAHIELCYNKYHYTSQLRKECSSHHSKAQQQRRHRLTRVINRHTLHTPITNNIMCLARLGIDQVHTESTKVRYI